MLPTNPRAVAVVTGAGSGIGRAIAVRLAQNGWALVLVDRDPAGLAATVGECAEGTRAMTVEGDVGVRETHETAAARAAAVGALRGWVNCAGITDPMSIDTLTDAVVMRTVNTNMLGTFWGSTTAVLALRAANSPGSIVNISSVHARRAYPGHAVYEMTKAAIEALSRNLAVTHAAEGIRCNAIAPGAVMTPALEHSLASAADPAAALRELTDMIPTGTAVSTVEVASLAAYLLSDEAPSLTGQTIVIDGAMTAHIGFRVAPEAQRIQ